MRIGGLVTFRPSPALNSGGPDPDDYFGRTFTTGGATNVYKYSDPALDKILNDARASIDPAGTEALVRPGTADSRLPGPGRSLGLWHLVHCDAVERRRLRTQRHPQPSRTPRGVNRTVILARRSVFSGLVGLLLTVFGVSVLTFAAVWMIPGDAVQVMLGGQRRGE